MSQLRMSWMFLILVNCKIWMATVELVLRVIVFHVIICVAMLYINYPRCGDCASSASFIRECNYVSSIGLCWREGVELTVHKESVVVEEIKKVELRSRRAQIFL